MLSDYKFPNAFKQHTLNPWEADVLLNATGFTAVTFKGCGQYERHTFDELKQAAIFADTNPRKRDWIIYAVSGTHDAPIGHVTNRV